MDVKETRKRVLSVLCTVLRQNLNFDAEIDVENLSEWNSLKHIEIMFALEDEFGIEFSEEELTSLKSIAKIVDAIQMRMLDET